MATSDSKLRTVLLKEMETWQRSLDALEEPWKERRAYLMGRIEQVREIAKVLGVQLKPPEPKPETGECSVCGSGPCPGSRA